MCRGNEGLGTYKGLGARDVDAAIALRSHSTATRRPCSEDASCALQGNVGELAPHFLFLEFGSRKQVKGAQWRGTIPGKFQYFAKIFYSRVFFSERKKNKKCKNLK